MRDAKRLGRAMVIAMLVSLLTMATVGMTVVAQDDEAEDIGLGFLALSLTIIIICLVIFLLIAILAAVWIYRDANRRGKSGALWAVLMFLATWFFFPIGTIIIAVIWILVRPPIGMPGGPPPQYGPPPQQPGYPPQQPPYYPPQQPGYPPRQP